MSSTITRVAASSLLMRRFVPEHNLRPSHRYTCFWIKRTCSSSSNAVQPQQQSVDSRLCQRILLPQHGQNGTLLLRSTSKCIGQVDIIPQWRDDTMLELMPIREDDSDTTRNDDEHSNSLVEVQYDDKQSLSSETQTISYEGLQLTLHRSGIATALGRKGSLVEVDPSPTEINEVSGVISGNSTFID